MTACRHSLLRGVDEDRMPSFYDKPFIRFPIYTLIGVTVIAVLVLSFYNWIIGSNLMVILAIVLYFIKKAISDFKSEMKGYITTLSYRLKKVGEEALMEMPIGIMLFNDQYQIEWSNPF